MQTPRLAVLCVLVGCGSSNPAGTDGNGSGGDGSGSGGVNLSDEHPGDVGRGGDPAVVWFEDFEEGSVAAITGRYNQAQGQARMQLVTDHAGGASALSPTA